MFHQGKSDEDDHKIIYERLLNLAVPPDPDGKGIKLEDCLEDYFNAQVDVFRDSLDDKVANRDTPTPKATIRLVDDGDRTTSLANSDETPTPQPLASPRRATLAHALSQGSEASSSSGPPPLRPRAATVIQRVVIDEDGRATSDPNSTSLQRTPTKGSVIVKAVTIPAWQFFRLMRE